MKSLPAKKLIRILEQNGFVLSRQRGSHKIYKNLKTGTTVVVPTHGGNRPISIGTFLAIVKQSKISKKDFW